MPELLAFVAVAAVVICTPGQDTALTIRNSLSGGRASGVATALGVALGQAAWTVAASVGLAAVVTASQPVYLVVKLAGAAFLVFLGVQSLLRALSGRPGATALAARTGTASTPGRALRQGVVSNLANPKMAAFFTSLLPQFADSLAGLLALGLVFSSLTFAWLSAYAVAVGAARGFVTRPAVRRAFDAILGAVLVALGLRLAAPEKR